MDNPAPSYDCWGCQGRPNKCIKLDADPHFAMYGRWKALVIPYFKDLDTGGYHVMPPPPPSYRSLYRSSDFDMRGGGVILFGTVFIEYWSPHDPPYRSSVFEVEPLNNHRGGRHKCTHPNQMGLMPTNGTYPNQAFEQKWLKAFRVVWKWIWQFESKLLLYTTGVSAGGGWLG
jgi:hypothetical protein